MTERRRRSIRLPHYDYSSAGAYFVTVCAYRRHPLFQEPTLAGIVDQAWLDLPRRFSNISLDAFVVMPNHVHFIIWLEPVGATLAVAQTGAGASPAPTLGDVVGSFKSLVAIEWLRHIRATGLRRSARVWQRNYYERVLRDDDELRRAREYISLNPLKWPLDSENPDRRPSAAYEAQWG